MFKTLIQGLGLVTLLFPLVLLAQHQPNAVAPHKCGVTQEAGELIRQRLMANRNFFARQQTQSFTNGRTITYIPLSIHNVAADIQGTGRTDEQVIMGFICGLNSIYADQSIQFYIYNQINNRVSGFIHSNARTFNALQNMYSYRISGTLNLVIGSSINNQVASWYDPSGDFVFLLKTMLSSEAKTEAHEIGHFFTLNHTFFDWENLDADALYGGGAVPASVRRASGFGNFTPENVARTGPTVNCATTADGFCDTPADYYSYRKACPYNPQVTDPTGGILDPDESNMMSYALDACVTTFTQEQKTAIAQDVAMRTWASNTPMNTTTITGTPTAVAPLDGDPLGSINNPTVRLEWSPVPGASWYYVEVFGTTIPNFWFPNVNDVIFKGIIYTGNAYFDLPTTDLVAGKYYAWRVKALNDVHTCAPISGYSKFEASASATNDVQNLAIEKQMSFDINANPVTVSYIPMTIYTAQEVVGSIRVYSLDGREVLSWTKQSFAQGESVVQLPANNLTNGVYLAVLHTERGQLQQKIVIQR